MDEPCSALDPIATAKIEELIHELRGKYAIVIVTHNMQQAARVSQRTAFFHLGTLVEYGKTTDIFTNPKQDRTKDYITGRYGRAIAAKGSYDGNSQRTYRQGLRRGSEPPARDRKSTRLNSSH